MSKKEDIHDKSIKQIEYPSYNQNIDELMKIADTLIDINQVKIMRTRQMNHLIEIYGQSVRFLGYCSQISNYASNNETMISKLMLYRREILLRYKDLFRDVDAKILKSLLVPPMKTKWYIQGIEQYKQMKEYCIMRYTNKIHQALKSGDEKNICKVIDSIIELDNYYDIYEKTIGVYINGDKMFADIMNKKYMSYIQL